MSGLHAVISIVVGDRYPAPDSSGAVSVCVVKIIAVNLPRSSSAPTAILGTMALQFDFVTVIMTKHPSSTAQVVGVSGQLIEVGTVLEVIILDEKEFLAAESCRGRPCAVTILSSGPVWVRPVAHIEGKGLRATKV